MNSKYYPKLKHHAELTQRILSSDLVKLANKAKQPRDLIVPVYNALSDIGIASQDDAHEVGSINPITV